VIARGVLKLAVAPRDGERHAAVAAQDLFEPGAMACSTPTTPRRGWAKPVEAALDMADALVVEPARVIEAWRGPAIPARSPGWRAGTGSGGCTIRRIARWPKPTPWCWPAAQGQARLWPAAPIRPVRGQATWTDRPAPAPAAFGAYAIPTRDGVLFGATHDRDVVETDAREADDRRNLRALAKGLPGLAARLADAPLRGRAAVRATTADHLPLAGAVPDAPDGLFVLGGLGGRGFCLAPLLAEHLTARILGLAPAPRPLPGRPARFSTRPETGQENAMKRTFLVLAASARHEDFATTTTVQVSRTMLSHSGCPIGRTRIA
jgi:tRNA 5-methylaminomethyl-2-thiouridine biosynthesis bifunctional protein